MFYRWTPIARRGTLPSASDREAGMSPVIDPLILVRAVHFAATALAAGTVSFLVARRAGARAAGAGSGWRVRRAAPLARLGRRSRSAIASGAVWLIWLASDIYGASLLNVCLHGGAWSVLTETRFGLGVDRAAGARAAARRAVAVAGDALAATCRCRRVRRLARAHRPCRRFARWRRTRASCAPTSCTCIAVGAWLGALPALALLLHQARRDQKQCARARRGAARRFPSLGIVSVAALMATGVVNSWNLLSGPRDLVATDYGRLLLLKIGLFAAMLGIAAVNRFRLTPQLAAPMRPLRARARAQQPGRDRRSAFASSCSSARWERWRRRCTTMCTSRPAGARRRRLCPHPHVRGDGRRHHRARARRPGACARFS